MIRISVCCAVLLSFLMPDLRAGPTAEERPPELMPYELQDQHDQVHRREDMRGRAVIILESDRGGSQYVAPWSDALRKEIQDQAWAKHVALIGVANLSAVPGVLRLVVKQIFRSTHKHSILLDWEGTFAATYGFQADHGNLQVFAQDGRLVHQAVLKELDSEQLARIVEHARSGTSR